MASFFFSANPLAKKVEKHEAIRENLNMAMGLTPQVLKTARANLDAVNQGRMCSEETMGQPVGGEDYIVKEAYRDGDHKITILARSIGGGKFEQRKVIEEYATPNTRVLEEIRGYRG